MITIKTLLTFAVAGAVVCGVSTSAAGSKPLTLAISPNYANDSTLFVGLLQASTALPGVYISHDGGTSWAPTSPDGQNWRHFPCPVAGICRRPDRLCRQPDLWLVRFVRWRHYMGRLTGSRHGCWWPSVPFTPRTGKYLWPESTEGSTRPPMAVKPGCCNAAPRQFARWTCRYRPTTPMIRPSLWDPFSKGY